MRTRIATGSSSATQIPGRREGESAVEPPALQGDIRPQQGALERLPKWLICIPLTVQWLWLALRYRSLTLPSAVNPAITAGGLVGEGKLEYFKAMGALAHLHTAPYCAWTAGDSACDGRLDHTLKVCGLGFPMVAKPDQGLCGFGVRRLDDKGELHAYLAAFPAGETVIFQQYLPHDGEAAIFYVRDPVSDQGRLTGLTFRHFPRVTGDGQTPLYTLIRADWRASRVCGSPLHHRPHDLQRVPRLGEVVRLATVGSTRVGGMYENGAPCVTAELTHAIDALARDMDEFYFGRFDVRFRSLSELKTGSGFTIMEVNGAGAEAIEAWDPAVGLVEGFNIIFTKQALLFATANAMRKRGARPIGLLALTRLQLRQNALNRRYPPSN